MFRLALLLLVLFTHVPSAWAVQLGDSREHIVAQYGPPAAASLDADHGMGTYRWAGWRLDVEVMQGVVQRLIFTKDTAFLTEAEQRQLLSDNGGIAVWQSVNHVAGDALAGKKWRRSTDGAEAFTLATDPHVMCLATRIWADAWTKAHQPVLRSQRTAASTSGSVQAPANPIAGLIVLAVIVGCIAFCGREIARVLKKKSHVSAPARNGLWTPSTLPQHLKSACVLAAPPPLPSISAQFPVSKFPARKTVEDLSWQEFELVVGELYRRQGYVVEMCSGDGSDGGVDLWLRKDGRTTLVQCKHWKVYKVGVSPVRELFGILNAEKADHAILVTTGRFTRDAKAFAAGKPVELIAGDQLRVAAEASKYSTEGDLLDAASWSAAFARSAKVPDPLCPLCRSSMVVRRGKQSGRKFWGCSTFPDCRGKRNVRPELMRA